jgi:hypothetical protein
MKKRKVRNNMRSSRAGSNSWGNALLVTMCTMQICYYSCIYILFTAIYALLLFLILPVSLYFANFIFKCNTSISELFGNQTVILHSYSYNPMNVFTYVSV